MPTKVNNLQELMDSCLSLSATAMSDDERIKQYKELFSGSAEEVNPQALLVSAMDAQKENNKYQQIVNLLGCIASPQKIKLIRNYFDIAELVTKVNYEIKNADHQPITIGFFTNFYSQEFREKIQMLIFLGNAIEAQLRVAYIWTHDVLQFILAELFFSENASPEQASSSAYQDMINIYPEVDRMSLDALLVHIDLFALLLLHAECYQGQPLLSALFNPVAENQSFRKYMIDALVNYAESGDVNNQSELWTAVKNTWLDPKLFKDCIEGELDNYGYETFTSKTVNNITTVLTKRIANKFDHSNKANYGNNASLSSSGLGLHATNTGNQETINNSSHEISANNKVG